MTVVYYDNLMESDPDSPEWLDIERIYCFDEDAFSDEDYQRLQAIFERLPEHRTVVGAHFARWFSDTDDAENGYLWGSMEPPGLQVAGTLRKHQWEEWDRLFQQAVADFPFRTL